MLKFGLRSKLLLSYAFITFLALVAFGGYILWFFHDSNIRSLTDSLQNNAFVAGEIFKYQRLQGNTSDLDVAIKDISNSNNLRITVIDVSGEVLADSWENPAQMENHRSRPEVLSAFEGKISSVTRFSTTLNENVLYAAVPINDEDGHVIGVVRVSETLRFIESGFRQIIYVLIVAMLLTWLVAAFLSNKLARHYTKPIEKITSTATEIAEGKIDKQVHVQTGDELELIAYSLNKLTANLEDKVNEVMSETKKLELILKNMDNAVILMDKFGRIQMANHKAHHLFDFSEEHCGQHSMSIISNSQFEIAFRQTVTELVTNKFLLKHSTRLMQRSFQVFLAPILSSDNEVDSVLAVFNDITALEERQNRESQFITNASHELATPLTTIKGFAETLMDGALYETRTAEKFLHIIHDEAYRMERLVVNLLDIVRLTSTDYVKTVTSQAVCLNEVIKTTVQEAASKLEDKAIKIEIVAEDVIEIDGSFEWLKKMIAHLLDNAIKYTPEQGCITLRCYVDNGSATIEVKDNGIGIFPGELTLIFDRFYRVDQSRTRSTGGTGLGLSIVKHIVDFHNGTITVHSVISEGTVFTIKLPLNLVKG